MSYIVHLRQKLRLIGQYAMPILTRQGVALWRSLVVTAMIAAPGSAIADIAYTPYTDTFEEYTNGTPLIDGTNGWYGSSNAIIVTNIVCTNLGVISTKAAMIPVDCTLSNRCVSTNNIGIWMQADANLAFYYSANQPAVNTNASTMFYVDSNGYFVVHNGAPDPTPTNSDNWVTLKTNVAGQAIDPLSANTNVQIILHQNYADKNWALYANNVLLTNAIGFINTTLTNFTGFDLYSGNTTSYLHNVYISDWWTVSPMNISHTIWQGQDVGSNKVEIWNNNGAIALVFTNTVIYTNSAGFENWLTVTPVTGTNYGEAQKSAVWVRMNTTTLPPRTNAYEAIVRVTAELGTMNSPQDVRVTVLVQGVGLGVSPTNLTKAVTVGQVATGDVFQVANTSAAPHGTISYTVTATSSPTAWLSVSPPSGNVQDNTNPVTVTYTTAGLAANWYTGRVDVVALGVGTQTVTVVLQVNNRPGVAWDAASRVWTNEVVAGGSLAGTNVEVWNASEAPMGQMNYTVSVLEDPDGWVSVSNASGVSTGDHRIVTVNYTTTGLAARIEGYTARLKVEGTDAATGIATTNGPLYMGLKLTVKGAPVLKTDVTSLSQTVLENHTGTNSFLVWNEGRDPRGGMRYTVTPNVNWVTAIPDTGVVTNDVHSVQMVWGTTGTTLPQGVYSGNLEVDAFDAQTGTRATGAPLTIPLTLTVTLRTPLNLELPTVVGTMFIGQTVEANVGLWQNQTRLTFGYQWERASNKAGSGIESCQAVGSNYVITTADRGKYLRVKVTATDPTPTYMSSTANSAWTNSAKVKALRADFNSDGITDLWSYDELSGTWHLNYGTARSAEGVFGGPGMTAVPGDYDGDGYEDAAVYEWAHGMWHICYLPRGAYVYGSLFGGTAEEAAATPVPADYDGDGATDVGLYYMGYWAILYSSTWSVGLVQPFADAWGEPVSGDWDGDGITEMGVYDDGVWTLRMGNGSVVEQEFGGGGSGVLPAPADYDADGATDLGVYDVGANQWRWRESRTGFEQSVSFGRGGIVPTPGYYDHDRSNDWAQVFLYNNDFIVWEVKRTTETNFWYRGQSYQQSTDRWRVSW